MLIIVWAITIAGLASGAITILYKIQNKATDFLSFLTQNWQISSVIFAVAFGAFIYTSTDGAWWIGVPAFCAGIPIWVVVLLFVTWAWNKIWAPKE